MIDPEMAWTLIKQNALKAMQVNLTWHSLVKGKTYRLSEVTDDSLKIVRVSGGNDEELTKSRVVKASNDFNNAKGKVKRRELISPTVAEETAFVLFHPNLSWDEKKEFIIEI